VTTQTLKIDDLIPYARNSRVHSPEQVAQLAASISAFGWTVPVLVADGVIVAGHGRLLAARQLCDAGEVLRLPSGEPLPRGEVPVIDCSGWTDEQRRAYVIADNRLAEGSTWDQDLLRIELEALEGFDLSLTGFDLAELDAIEAEGFDVQATDANAATERDHREPAQAGQEPAPWDDPADTAPAEPQAKQTRTVYPLVLSLNRAQYERWQALKKRGGFDDMALFAQLLEDF
jgi:ParB-like chromosome segregation protein Spo0J